jgi:hypothetical protein
VPCPKKADGYIGYKDVVTVELSAVPLSKPVVVLPPDPAGKET